MTLKERIITQALTFGEVQMDQPFAKFHDYDVLRHTKSGKWFGLIMTVDKSKLGLNEDGSVLILDVKAEPEMVSILQQAPGYFPAHHMNKQHWLTLLLDGSIAEAQVIKHLEDSYHLTK